MNRVMKCQKCEHPTISGVYCQKKQHYYCISCLPKICMKTHYFNTISKKKCKTCLKDLQFCKCKRAHQLKQLDRCFNCYKSDDNKEFFCNSFCGHFLCKQCWFKNQPKECKVILCKINIDQQSARIFFNCCSFCGLQIQKQNNVQKDKLCKKCKLNLQAENFSFTRPPESKLKEYNQNKQKDINDIQSNFKSNKIEKEKNIMNSDRKTSELGFSEQKQFQKIPNSAPKKIVITKISPKKETTFPQNNYQSLTQINEIIKNKLHIKDNDVSKQKTPVKKQHKTSQQYTQSVSKNELVSKSKNQQNLSASKLIKIKKTTVLNRLQPIYSYTLCQFCRNVLNIKVLLQNRCGGKHKICRSCSILNRNKKECSVCQSEVKQIYNKLYTYKQADPNKKIEQFKKQNKKKTICTRCNTILSQNKVVDIKGRPVCRYCVCYINNQIKL